MEYKDLIKAIDPDDIIRYAPRTGNPFVDIGVRVGARLLFGRRGIDQAAELEEDDEKEIDPRLMGKLLVNEMSRQGQGVYVVAGPRGSGKTSFCCYITQELSDSGTKAPVFSVNMPKGLSWIEDIPPEKLEKLPRKSIVILDDTGLMFSSRDYASKQAQLLHETITLARHKDMTLIANTGITSSMDKYLLDCDAAFFKRPSALSMDIERSGLQRRILPKVIRAYEELGETFEGEKSYIYVQADRFRIWGLMWYPMAKGYTVSVSKNKG